MHSQFDIGPENTVIVTLDKQANVRLMDDINFQRFRGGRQCTYYGGRAVTSPFRVSPPHRGRWNLVIDLGGARGTLRHSVSVI